MNNTQVTSNNVRKKRRQAAQVAELVDALRSGRSSRKGVGVQIPSWAPTHI